MLVKEVVGSLVELGELGFNALHTVLRAESTIWSPPVLTFPPPPPHTPTIIFYIMEGFLPIQNAFCFSALLSDLNTNKSLESKILLKRYYDQIFTPCYFRFIT